MKNKNIFKRTSQKTYRLCSWRCAVNNEECSCDQCDYKTKRKDNLKKHIDSVHGDVRYSCDQCYYKATKRTHLKTHIDSVHGDVWYSCDQCDYKSKCKCNLKRHKEYGHGNVWHSCDQKTKKKLLLVLQLANLKTDEPTRQRNKISGHI